MNDSVMPGRFSKHIRWPKTQNEYCKHAQSIRETKASYASVLLRNFDTSTDAGYLSFATIADLNKKAR